MLFSTSSWIKQVKFGKEYHGSLDIEGIRFIYTLEFGQPLYEPCGERIAIGVGIVNRFGKEVNLEDPMQDFLKQRIAGDVLEFYHKIREFGICDGYLGGAFKKDNSRQYEVIENRIEWSETYSLRMDLPFQKNRNEIRKLLQGNKGTS